MEEELRMLKYFMLTKKDTNRAAIDKVTEYIVHYFSKGEKQRDKYYLKQLEQDCKAILYPENENSKLILIAVQDLIEEGLLKEVESDEGKYLVLTDRVKTFMNI